MAGHLGRPEDALVLDETAPLKKARMPVGVARQYAGITGQIESCQVKVLRVCLRYRKRADRLGAYVPAG
ncbi:transposase [Streptomyces sp. NBC_01264]|uniref:transposase n=1 Tax=Streptomyces sp. NBC_01264 TaxID=2903804 RepID=UPI003D2FB65E